MSDDRWAFVAEFQSNNDKRGRRQSWQSVEPWLDVTRDYWAAITLRVRKALERSDDRLQDLGGDPFRTRAFDFRPLRLAREEAWSDWLAHLLEHARSTELALLFRVDAPRGVLNVEREIEVRDDVDGNRRIDLVATWPDGCRTHIEVKIWDVAIEKTWHTAHLAEQSAPNCAWNHIVLLPEENVQLVDEAWQQIETLGRYKQRVRVVTWGEVAAALRQSLWKRKESVRWMAFAHAFVAAIEQRVMRLDPIEGESVMRSDALAILNILERYER